MTQRGFIQLSLMGWVAVGAAVIILGLSVLLKIEKASHASTKKEYALFVAEVKAKGEAAEIKARAQEKADLAKKVKADEDYKKLLAANQSLNKRLRDNASRSSLPDAPADSRSPELACFSRADLDRALQRFTGGTAELIVEGTESALALDSVKRWAQTQ